MQYQSGIFDSFFKPYTTTGVSQIENVQKLHYKPNMTSSHVQADTMEKKTKKADAAENMKDSILPNDPITKLRVKIEQATKVPDYIYNGLNGDPDANFFEYLQLSNIPYYIGGPVLTGMFMAGISKIDQAARNSAIK
ncbi:MAG: hypothetical protein WC197_08930 [Candidatus Gastranaerophilaceae bacterium]|jgi:hypothetical protein